MKRIGLVALALAASTSVSLAADMAPAPLAPVWTGFYVGVMAGYGGGDFDYSAVFTDDVGSEASGGASLTSGGGFLGAQIGYNWQMDNMVIGVESDMAWSGIKGNLELSLSSPVSGSMNAGSEVDWFGTTRLRAGWTATPQLLLYATGGVAYGAVTSSYDLSDLGPGAPSDSTSDTQWGWTAGAGFEYAVTERISLKTEYLYVDLASQNLLNTSFSQSSQKIDADTAFHTVKAGVNIRF